MSMRPIIKIRLQSFEQVARRALSYQLVAKTLESLGGHDRHVDRGALIAATKETLNRLGFSIRNLDGTVSSFCALSGVDAIFEWPDGRVTPFESNRTAPKASRRANHGDLGLPATTSISDDADR